MAEIWGYVFKNENLLKEALTHSSLNSTVNNERLEFLGDAVLGLIVSRFLFEHFPDKREGFLSNLKSRMTSRKMAYLLLKEDEEVVRKFKVDSGLRGNMTVALYANLFEAIIGAIFLDSNFEVVYNVLINRYGKRLLEFAKDDRLRDFKSELIEMLQALHEKDKLKFEVSRNGDRFEVRVIFDGEEIGSGEGRSIKEAEQQASSKAIIKLKSIKGV